MQNEINEQDGLPKPSYYAVIPANVRYCKELKPNAKLLYGEITALSNAKGYCYASNRYFAELYGIERIQTISDWVGQLQKLGFISVELTYKGKEIDQRIIKIIPNEKTLEVQLKNVVPTTENSCTPTTKKRCVNNTSSNNTINTKSNKLLLGSGNVPLPAPEATYNDFLAANNFSRLSLTAFTLTDAQAQAAKIKHGEAGYLSTLAKLDDYLEKNPTYMQSKKDFNAVFRKFADNDDLSAAKIAWNAFFTAKHGQSYTKYSKADESALETILKHIKEKLKDGDSIGSKIAGFFNALSQLPKYNEPMNCKLTFIANDYTNIVAHLGKQREAQKQVVPTLSPADAKDAAIKGLAEIGLTDEMIGFIQSAKCTDLQTAKNLTISQLFKAGKFDVANGDKFNQCLKVLRPTLR